MTLATTLLDKDAIRELDATSVGQLMSIHGDFRVVTEYATGQGYWSPGDGEPQIVLDPPSAQAAGRCVASRVRGMAFPSLGAIHPSRCRWCATPTPQLLRSLDHGTYMSRYITSEYIVWPAKGGAYTRSSSRVGMYEHPAWAGYWSLAAEDRAYLVAQQQAVAA